MQYRLPFARSLTGSPYWPSRGFLSGVALSAPFFVNTFFNAAAVLCILPLLGDILLRGVRIRSLFSITPLLVVLYALALLHVLALGTTPYSTDVLRPLIWAGALVGFVLVAIDPRDRPQDIIVGLLALVSSTAAFFAVAGFAKYLLQIKGYVFGFLINNCSGYYPQGTTFCVDYNLYSLYLAVAAIGLSVFVLSKKHTKFASAVLLISIGVVVAAGIHSGSRRFYLAALLIPAVWIAYALWARPWREVAKLSILPLLTAAALHFAADYPYERVSDADMQTVEEAISSIFAPDADHPSQAALPPPDPSFIPPEGVIADEPSLKARLVSPSLLAETMSAENMYGLSTRAGRWELGWQMVREYNYIGGRGFAYHEVYSCTFVDCAHIDYPHLTVLSAWIGFGVVGLALALAFYGVTGWNMWRAGKAGILTGATPLALAALPFSFISGDTIFSIPHMLVGALLVGIAAQEYGTRLRP